MCCILHKYITYLKYRTVAQERLEMTKKSTKLPKRSKLAEKSRNDVKKTK